MLTKILVWNYKFLVYIVKHLNSLLNAWKLLNSLLNICLENFSTKIQNIWSKSNVDCEMQAKILSVHLIKRKSFSWRYSTVIVIDNNLRFQTWLNSKVLSVIQRDLQTIYAAISSRNIPFNLFVISSPGLFRLHGFHLHPIPKSHATSQLARR